MIRPVRRTAARALASLPAVMCLAAVSEVAPLPDPEGPVLLTVSGDIAATNAGGTAEFDRAMLEALGMMSFETSTIWTEGVQRFSGPPLAALLERLGVDPEGGATLRATAVNDYAIEIPAADAVPGGPILAIERGGRPMTLRGKGPIWIVYPYDSAAQYRTKVIYSRSIWQLDRLSVEG